MSSDNACEESSESRTALPPRSSGSCGDGLLSQAMVDFSQSQSSQSSPISCDHRQDLVDSIEIRNQDENKENEKTTSNHESVHLLEKVDSLMNVVLFGEENQTGSKSSNLFASAGIEIQDEMHLDSGIPATCQESQKSSSEIKEKPLTSRGTKVVVSMGTSSTSRPISAGSRPAAQGQRAFSQTNHPTSTSTQKPGFRVFGDRGLVNVGAHSSTQAKTTTLTSSTFSQKRKLFNNNPIPTDSGKVTPTILAPVNGNAAPRSAAQAGNITPRV